MVVYLTRLRALAKRKPRGDTAAAAAAAAAAAEVAFSNAHTRVTISAVTAEQEAYKSVRGDDAATATVYTVYFEQQQTQRRRHEVSN